MSFSVYLDNQSKNTAGHVSSVNDESSTTSATLPVASEIRRIETALLSLSSIQDCVVLEQTTDTQSVERVAYVVRGESFDSQQLHFQLQKILPTTPLPTTYISLSVLPLTSKGQVDRQALSNVVQEASLFQKTYGSLRSPWDNSTVPVTTDPDEDKLLSNLPSNDLPLTQNNSLYRKSWQVRSIPSEICLTSSGQSLILIDQLGFGSQLCEQLDQLNLPYIKVEPGSDFARLSDNHYYLNPVNRDHYQQLLSAIVTEDLPITEILHLWTYHRLFRAVAKEKALEYSLDLGVHSLEFLCQTLATTQGKQTSVRLLVATNHTQALVPWSRKCCDRTPEIRLLQKYTQQQPWLECCHLDLPEAELKENVNRILQELSTVSGKVEVTYHQDQRWVAVIEPTPMNLT
ncbi:MAG: hypothetical protein WBA13_00475 [Microcoleaceae cyanobacterium]